jgi:hypothetical protein
MFFFLSFSCNKFIISKNCLPTMHYFSLRTCTSFFLSNKSVFFACSLYTGQNPIYGILFIRYNT